MKKSKLIIALILAALAAVSLFAFGACGSEPLQEHVHDFEKDPNSTVFGVCKSAATCTEPAVYYKTCKCGVMSEETFEYGDPLGHAFDESTAQPIVLKTEEGKCEGHTKIVECTRCEEWFASADKFAPSCDDWKVSVEPTLESVGTLSGTCKYCHNSAKIDIPKLGGKLTVLDKELSCPKIETVKNATCCSSGEDKYAITVDGQSFTFIDYPAQLLHKFNGTEIYDNYRSYDDGKTPVNIITEYLTGKKTYDIEAIEEGKYTDPVSSGVGAEIGFYNGAKRTCKDEGIKGFFKCDECNNYYSAYFRENHLKSYKDKGATQTDDQKAKSIIATCRSEGKYYFNCKCGNEMIETQKQLDHNYSYAFYETEEENVWNIIGVCQNNFNGISCGCKDEKAKGVKFSDLKIKTEAQCEKSAVYSYTIGSEEYTIEIPDGKQTHTYKYTDENGKEHKVSLKYDPNDPRNLNGSVKVYKKSDLPGITMVGESVKYAACSNTGNLALYTCSECDNSYYVRVKEDHGNLTIKSQPETCETDEVITYHCSTCGETWNETEKGKYNEKSGHDWKTIEFKEPTKTEKGHKTFKCSHCNETHEISLPELVDGPDIYGVKTTAAASCKEAGKKVYTYKYNDGKGNYYKDKDGNDITNKGLPEIKIEIVIPTTNEHTHDSSKLQTVTINGTKYYGYICSVCGRFIIVEEIS